MLASEKKFTEGPWCFQERERNEHNVRVFEIGQENDCVCGIADVYGDEETARLISTSPELYTLVKQAREFLGHIANTLEQKRWLLSADATLAKAEAV